MGQRGGLPFTTDDRDRDVTGVVAADVDDDDGSRLGLAPGKVGLSVLVLARESSEEVVKSFRGGEANNIGSTIVIGCDGV